MRRQTCCTMMLGVAMAAGTMYAQTNGGGGSPTAGSTGAGTAGGSTSPNATPMPGAMDSTMNSPMKMDDKAFVKKAIMGNNGEIATAKMALDKSQNDQVKQYAQKMIDDHTKMLDDLHTIAQQENIKFEDKPTPDGMKLSKKLEALNGPAFDKAYIDGMVKDHKGDVRDFTMESQSGKDQATKEAATKSLPVIKDHLQMVQGLQKTIS